jgi:peptidoglycan/LPS O-acetylase OafA/YrhL
MTSETLPVRTVLRYDFLDGVRALLALYVVAHHSCYAALGYNALGASPYFRILSDGHFAVCFFIVLSGYCLMLPVLKNEFRLPRGPVFFLRRRAWRILPPYYLALALSLLLIGLFISQPTGSQWDVSLPVTSGNIATHLLLVQNFFADDFYKINFVFWSIAVEWQIYFLFPLLLWAWRSIGPVYSTSAAVLISSLLEKKTGHFSHVHFIGLFALGMLGAAICFSENRATVRFKALPWTPIAIGTGAASFLSSYVEHEWVQFVADALFGCCASSILIIAALRPKGWVHAFLNLKPLVFVGSFSYSLYLIHAPLIQVLWLYVFPSLRSYPNLLCTVLLGAGIPMILIISYLFYLGCEKPFLEKKRTETIHVR